MPGLPRKSHAMGSRPALVLVDLRIDSRVQPLPGGTVIEKQIDSGQVLSAAQAGVQA
jgi:hypothetical protein